MKTCPAALPSKWFSPVFNAKKKEALLKKKFRAHRYIPRRAGKNSGKTEHFELGWWQVIRLKVYLLVFYLESLVTLAFLGLLLFGLGYLILQR